MTERWKHTKGSPGIQAPLTFRDDYVISHRPQQFTVSYRPPGEHHHVGTGATLREAMTLANQHAKARR